MQTTVTKGLMPTSAIRFRQDLVCKRIRMGNQRMWVLKDPLSRAYHYVSEREFTILQFLNGERSIRDLVAMCKQQFAPEYVSSQSILQFVSDAHSKQILDVLGNRSVTEKGSRKQSRSRWSNPLAIRLPGINPDRFLQSIERMIPRFDISPLAVGGLLLTAFIVAVVSVLVHFDAFCDQLAVATQRAGMSWWWLLALVIGVTKIVHELAHAITCKTLGGECREIGLMFLVGIPCLYCDVSDAWMFSERWKRIAVSSAGIIAECVIASLSVCVWMLADAGALRDLCVTVAVVCSITTILFNGNPLLRYDGYYMLSDWVGIPNLWSRSRQVVLDKCRRVLWGLPNTSNESESKQHMRGERFFLAGYAVVSGTYRAAVLVTIAWIGYQFLATNDLWLLGMFCFAAAVTLVLYRTIRPVLQSPDRRVARVSKIRMGRGLFGILSVVAIGVLLVPLPYSVRAPASVRVAMARSVYVTTPGELVQAIAYGQHVQKGDVIARLSNPDVQLQLSRVASERSIHEVQLTAFRRQMNQDPTLAIQVASLQQRRQASIQREQILTEEVSELVIRAPTTGTLYAPSVSLIDSNLGDRESQLLRQQPLLAQNQDAFLDVGTQLGHVGDAKRRELVALVDQNSISQINVGQSVTLSLPSLPSKMFNGWVAEVASAPIEKIPDAFYLSGAFAPPARATPPTLYRVMVAVNENPVGLPMNVVGEVHIATAYRSILSRIWSQVRHSLKI